MVLHKVFYVCVCELRAHVFMHVCISVYVYVHVSMYIYMDLRWKIECSLQLE